MRRAEKSALSFLRWNGLDGSFAKVFGFGWVIITGLWAVAFFGDSSFTVARFGKRSPKWVFQLLSYAWPVVPAILVALQGN